MRCVRRRRRRRSRTRCWRLRRDWAPGTREQGTRGNEVRDWALRDALGIAGLAGKVELETGEDFSGGQDDSHCCGLQGAAGGVLAERAVGERIEAILELSETAYSFVGSGGYGHRIPRTEEGSSRSVVRVQPHKVQYRVVGGYAVGI